MQCLRGASCASLLANGCCCSCAFKRRSAACSNLYLKWLLECYRACAALVRSVQHLQLLHADCTLICVNPLTEITSQSSVLQYTVSGEGYSIHIPQCTHVHHALYKALKFREPKVKCTELMNSEIRLPTELG